MNTKNIKLLSFILVFLTIIAISPMAFAIDGLLKVQFYDENSLAILDGNVSIVDVTNNVTYNPDANGYWDTNLTFLNWEDKYINAYVERKVAGITTHTRRNFQFYWNADQNYDLSFALLPVGLGEDIEFLVKDTNNELWDNKYVQFRGDVTSTNDVNGYFSARQQFPGLTYTSIQKLSVSEDGKYIFASNYNTRLYLSSNYGESFNEVQPIGNSNAGWWANTISDDGKYLIAAIFAGRVHRSADYGATWAETQPLGAANAQWQFADTDSTGQYVIIATNNARIYRSTNYGVNWAEIQPAGAANKNWSVVSYSKDGAYALTGFTTSGRLYLSSNYGANWAETQPAGNTNQVWSAADISEDGQYMLAGVKGGRLYRSVNYGANWAETQPAGNQNQEWGSVFVSSNGKYMFANGSTWVYFSSDYGATWTQTSLTVNNGTAGAYQSSVNYNIIYTSADRVYYGEPTFNTLEDITFSFSRTSSAGIFSDYLLTDGDYNAVLYNETGTEGDTYQKTTVNVKKPKNEKSLADISPYDVEVGGLLIYSLSNQTAAQTPINIFGGTTSTYDFTVVDYNADPVDRIYIPRTYNVKNPFGSSYSTTYNLQPYLITKEDGVIPSIVVYDELKTPFPGITVAIFKQISGSMQLVEQKVTDSTGRTSFAGFPLDVYYIYLYDDGELKGSYQIQVRDTGETFYFVIQRGFDNPIVYRGLDLKYSWNNTPAYVDITTDNIDVNVSVYADYLDSFDITGYSIKTYQNDTLKETETGVLSGTSVTFTESFSRLNYTAGIPVKVVVDVTFEYNGETRVLNILKTIAVDSKASGLLTVLENFPSKVGRLWTILLSILMTITALVLIGTSDFVAKDYLIYVGLLILGFFVFIGWMSTGVSIFGIDSMWFIYIVTIIAAVGFSLQDVQR